LGKKPRSLIRRPASDASAHHNLVASIASFGASNANSGAVAGAEERSSDAARGVQGLGMMNSAESAAGVSQRRAPAGSFRSASQCDQATNGCVVVISVPVVPVMESADVWN
jgi:hypothetical protein